MASDLSKLIQDSFTLTLNGLLAKDAKILQITKAHEKDLHNLQLLKVQSSFEFTNFTSQLSFILPAKSCSLIFNTMMGSPIDDLSDDIDDDAEDAIGEFISNTSGTLTTSINGENFEDLGQTKFNIASKETIQSSSITELDNLYKYQIDLEDSELIIFVLFDEVLIPYIEDTAASEVTHHEEIPEEIEEIEDEVQELEKVQKEETPKKKEPIEDNISKEAEITKTKKFTIPQDKKMKIIIMAVAGVLTFVLLLFLTMYFTGSSEPEKTENKEDINNKKVMIDPNKIDVIKYKTPKKVKFKVTDINKNRLNAKLEELTKFKVLTANEIEAQKLAEKNRLFELEKEKELLAFAKRNHEEPLIIEKKIIADKKIEKEVQNKETKTQAKIENKDTNINNKIELTTPEIIKAQIPIEKELNYVVTTSLKYGLFKSLVQETATTQARISICNNNEGKTTIYIGPFETEILQNEMITLIKNNNNSINLIAENITEKEFNSKCNLE